MDALKWIAGLLAAALTGALIAVLVNAIYRGGADAGDYLQFFGGVLGAGFAVVGAVFFERRKVTVQRREEHSSIRMALLDAADYFRDEIARPDPCATEYAQMATELAHIQDRVDAVVWILDILPATRLQGLDQLRILIAARTELRRWSIDLAKFRESFLDKQVDLAFFKAVKGKCNVGEEYSKSLARFVGNLR